MIARGGAFAGEEVVDEGFEELWRASPSGTRPPDQGRSGGASAPPVLAGRAGSGLPRGRRRSGAEEMTGPMMDDEPAGWGSGIAPSDTDAGVSEAREGSEYPAESAEQGAIATRIVSLDPEGDRHTRIVDVSVPAMVRRRLRERDGGGAGLGDDGVEETRSLFDEVWRGLRLFYLRMHSFDRWTTWMLLVALLGVFLPWERQRGLGLVSGIEGFGGVSIFAVVAAFASLYGRTERRRLGGLLIMVQLLMVAGVSAVPVFLVINGAGEHHYVAGLYTTILSGGLALLFTFARLTRLSV